MEVGLIERYIDDDAFGDLSMPFAESVVIASTVAERLRINLQVTHNPLPYVKTATDSGLDIVQPETVTIPPHTPMQLDTGIYVASIPDYMEIQVRPRSSTIMRGLHVSFGTVDNGFQLRTGQGDLQDYHIRLGVANFTAKPVTIEAGQRIAQLVANPFDYAVDIFAVNDVPVTAQNMRR